MTAATRPSRMRRGATAIEYGVIAALVAVSIIVALFLLGGDIVGLFTKTDDAMASLNGPQAPAPPSPLANAFAANVGGDGVMDIYEYYDAVEELRDMDPNDDMDQSWNVNQKAEWLSAGGGGYGWTTTIDETQFEALFD